MSQRELHAVDWVDIARRGPLAVIDGDESLGPPRALRGSDVVIDGAKYRVLGVQTHTVPDPLTVGRPFGLLVEALD